MSRPAELNQSVSDADIDLTNLANKDPAAALARVATILGHLNTHCTPEEHRTLRTVSGRIGRRALKKLEDNA